ncbi:MAG: Cyanophycinase [Micavibrio sp.]|nr:Cyanophycinase [Micavibrio sp.]
MKVETVKKSKPAAKEKQTSSVRKKLRPARPRKGTLVIIGGHEDKENERVILKEVAQLLNNGKLVVSTVASEEPAGYFESYQKAFKAINSSELVELYIADRHESLDPEKLKVLDNASGIYFTGGDQLRISSQIGDTPFEVRVKEIYEQGGVIAGTSAGASAMAEVMLVRGASGESYKIGDLHLSPGLGLVPNVIIDQHFAERGRIGRLMGAIALNPRILGIGIDEDTAIVVRDKKFTVIGSGAVYVVDGSAVTHSNIAEGEPDSVLSLFGVTMQVLSAGDKYDLVKRLAIPKARPKKKSADAQA